MKQIVLVGSIGLMLTLSGCKTARRVHDPEFAQVIQSVERALTAPDTVGEALAVADPSLEGPHPLDDYVQVALRQNPDIHAARKRLESLALQVPVAASLQDPMLGVNAAAEPVQTAAGQQELLMTASQKLPWLGKLTLRADVAESQANVARAELAVIELATIEKVKRGYYNLYFIQEAIAITESEQGLLREILDVANVRYKTGKTSQQDVLRAELELLNTENDLIVLRQQLESAQARLAQLLHVAPNANVLALRDLPTEQLTAELEDLQRQAITARPELHAQLAALDRDRQAVELARLDYFPDVTLGVTWSDIASAGISPVANGRDAVLIGATVNLPIYRKRLDASVRSAEAKLVATARQYDSLSDTTQQQVVDLFVQARSQEDLLALFRQSILPKARQTLDVSTRAYSVGEVDFLQLIDNWRQLLRYEIAEKRLQATLRQTLASLERVVGGARVSAQFAAPPAEAPQP